MLYPSISGHIPSDGVHPHLTAYEFRAVVSLPFCRCLSADTSIFEPVILLVILLILGSRVFQAGAVAPPKSSPKLADTIPCCPLFPYLLVKRLPTSPGLAILCVAPLVFCASTSPHRAVESGLYCPALLCPILLRTSSFTVSLALEDF
jgi:hypothetical protein